MKENNPKSAFLHPKVERWVLCPEQPPWCRLLLKAHGPTWGKQGWYKVLAWPWPWGDWRWWHGAHSDAGILRILIPVLTRVRAADQVFSSGLKATGFWLLSNFILYWLHFKMKCLTVALPVRVWFCGMLAFILGRLTYKGESGSESWVLCYQTIVSTRFVTCA